MMTTFHCLRPSWLLAFIPLILVIFFQRKRYQQSNWRSVCDPELLDFLLVPNPQKNSALYTLVAALFFMTIGLAGPSWVQLPVPSYQNAEPRVVLVDFSDNMQATDLAPTRLARAVFKLHDLFKTNNGEQYGLIAFTSQPFVVSPITEDAHTIDSLLSALTPDIMPVQGFQLDSALLAAAELIKQATYSHGQLLVITASPPDSGAMAMVKKLSQQGIFTSFLPISKSSTLSALYKKLAKAGQGQVLTYSENDNDLQDWLQQSANNKHFKRNQKNTAPIWRDEGRWFLLPALLLLIPIFRRGWLHRIDS